MAELYSNLADIKMALSDAKLALHEKDAQIQKLKTQIEALQSGESCAICGAGKLKVTASRPHPQFGVFGHQERTLACQNPDCGHTEKRKFIPK